MLHRLLAVLAYPAHVVNRALADALGRVGLRRVPGALVVGLAIGALAVSTTSATVAAYEARPEPREVTIAEVTDGRIRSGVWIMFDAQLLDGPHRAGVEISVGGGAATIAERVHYLVADPASPDRALIVRSPQPIGALEASTGAVELDGTIAEDPFNMRSLLTEWGLAERYPDVSFSESRLVAYGFATPFREPSWLGSVLLWIATMLLVGGAFVPQPVLRLAPAEPSRGEPPIELAIHGVLPTPRGMVHLRGTPARLAWMNVEDVARTRWRYWGAALGDVRGDVEEAVRAHGREGERLVIHGPSGSVIWPIEASERLSLDAGEAYLGLKRYPALRVRGDGAAATLTFGDAADRDAAAAVLRRGDSGR
jgi:hypothetical protein